MTDGPHAAVLGGGIAGVASAWYLARNGYRVTVVERRRGAGLETSFANGALITPSMSDPWASPGIPMLILKWLGREDAPFLLRLRALPGLFSWGLQFLRQCNDDDWHRNTRNTLRLCTYSHACLHELVRETGVGYESNPRGTLRLFRDSLSMEKSSRAAELLQQLGVRLTTLDSAVMPDPCPQQVPGDAAVARLLRRAPSRGSTSVLRVPPPTSRTTAALPLRSREAPRHRDGSRCDGKPDKCHHADESANMTA